VRKVKEELLRVKKDHNAIYREKIGPEIHSVKWPRWAMGCREGWNVYDAVQIQLKEELPAGRRDCRSAVVYGIGCCR
jgi:hypothetical protein